MAVGDSYVFPGFLTPVLTKLFFPKPLTTFPTCFCRGERRKYGSNSQPPGHESDTFFFSIFRSIWNVTQPYGLANQKLCYIPKRLYYILKQLLLHFNSQILEKKTNNVHENGWSVRTQVTCSTPYH